MCQEGWETVSKQLVSEEQQAAVKAASKKAKKLRQKLSRQQAQHAGTDKAFADLQSVNDLKHSSDTTAAACEELLQSAACEPGRVACGKPDSTAGSTHQADADLQLGKQAMLRFKEPNSSMENNSFLQELFTCPITQVSPLNNKKASQSHAAPVL